MFTCKTCDSYTTRVLAGLVVAVTIVVGSLTYAASNVQAYL
jgi:hypothetical protein